MPFSKYKLCVHRDSPLNKKNLLHLRSFQIHRIIKKHIFLKVALIMSWYY